MLFLRGFKKQMDFYLTAKVFIAIDIFFLHLTLRYKPFLFMFEVSV